jgi:aspartate kinase
LSELGILTDMVMLLAREDDPSQELAFTVERRSLARVQSLIETLERELGLPRVDIDRNIARISVVGRGLSSRPQIVASIFETLSSAAIPVQMVASGDIKVSALVRSELAENAVRLIHDRFGLSRSVADGI